MLISVISDLKSQRCVVPDNVTKLFFDLMKLVARLTRFNSNCQILLFCILLYILVGCIVFENSHKTYLI